MPFLLGKESAQVRQIAVERISPSKYQPRKIFSEAALSELAASIKEHGVLQPLLAVREGEGYRLIAGERRLRAAKLAGIRTVPVLVMERDSRECAQISVTENVQREQLNFFEEAAAYARLIGDFGMTQAQIAEKLGKKQSTVSNKLRLLRLPPAAQVIITASGLSERHARELLRIRERAVLFEALDKIIRKSMTVKQTAQYIDALLAAPAARPQRIGRVSDMRIYLNTINKAVELIKKTGIKPRTELIDREGFVEYIIQIPKTGG